MISFGSDPEFMIVDTNGQLKSAIGVVPGSSQARYKNQFYYDNVLAECAIQPGFSKSESLTNFRLCLAEYANLVKPFKLCVKAFDNYPKQELNHKDARKVGCNDEFCPYEFSQISPPQTDIKYSTQRSAGGHIHIGDSGWVRKVVKWGKPKTKVVFRVGAWDTAKVLDLFVGLPSVLLDTDPSTKLRKKLYGKAGRFRDTKYGIEYRSLSNFWLQSPVYVGLVYDLCELAIDFVNDPVCRNDLWTYHEKEFPENIENVYEFKYDTEKVRNAINQCDKELAKEMLEFLVEKCYFPEHLYLKIVNGYFNVYSEFYKAWDIQAA